MLLGGQLGGICKIIGDCYICQATQFVLYMIVYCMPSNSTL